MAGHLTHEQQVSLLKQEVDILKEQLNLLNARQELDLAKQVQDAQATKALLDANKSKLDSEYAEAVAQAQLPFGELQGMQSGLNGLSMPKGKEGTVSVDGGKPGTLFLVSRRPQLDLLNWMADSLVAACRDNNVRPEEIVVLTEAKLRQSLVATFTSNWISSSIRGLDDAIQNLAARARPGGETDAAGPSPATAAIPFPALNAAAYGIGFTLDTVNSLLKLLRTDREMQIFETDTEAMQMLIYLLEMRHFVCAASAGIQQDKMLCQADSLLRDLASLRKSMETAKQALDTAVRSPDAFAATQIDDLRCAIDEAVLLIDSLHPSKKPEAFWAQVEGMVLAGQLDKKWRLIVELKAQVVQEKTSNFFMGDHINAAAEMLLSYRLLDAKNVQKKANVILHGSKNSNLRYDDVVDMSIYCQNTPVDD